MRALCTVLLLVFLAPSASAVEIAADSAEIRTQMQAVERAIDARFRALSGQQPMTLLGSARGVYLAGYGAVFTLEVNLAPVANLSPFRQSYSEEEKSQLNVRKRQRLETLEQQARDILVAETKRLTALPVGEKVALAVSLFHFAWEDLTQLPSQMVMAAVRSVLDQARGGTIAAADLKQRLEVGYF